MIIVLFIVLLIIAILCVVLCKEPEIVREVNRRYSVLRQNVDGHPKFEKLKTPVLLTFFEKRYGEVGYNVNKGIEIGICIDGDPNEVFHVLIHELAHSISKRYDHSKAFWKNYDELKDFCIDLGIYEEIKEKTKFCGKHVKD